MNKNFRQYISNKIKLICVLIADWCGWLYFVDNRIIQRYIGTQKASIKYPVKHPYKGVVKFSRHKLIYSILSLILNLTFIIVGIVGIVLFLHEITSETSLIDQLTKIASVVLDTASVVLSAIFTSELFIIIWLLILFLIGHWTK